MTTTNRQETFWHPRTGTRYTFPRDARRYLALVERIYAHPCEHRHFDCAGWDGGPCSAQVEAWYVDVEEER